MPRKHRVVVTLSDAIKVQLNIDNVPHDNRTCQCCRARWLWICIYLSYFQSKEIE